MRRRDHGLRGQAVIEVERRMSRLSHATKGVCMRVRVRG